MFLKRKLLHILAGFSLAFFVSSSVGAQAQPQDTLKVYAFIVNGDTIPGGRLADVAVHTRIQEKWRKYWAEWTRLRNAVYVTFPYARAAGRIMNEVNAELNGVTDEKLRRAIIRKREKDLKREFTSKLTQLSIYQGKVLMKLINRETGNNCFEIIKEYKGGFNAGLWQTIAIVVGSNLKQAYDPNDRSNNDHDIELIVRDVERMYGLRG
ncbi:DUF4294 domain-containing protein [Segetibacter sp. 3557_3]|uniref:DUF4294 domain-containing protein n=1 Tax=Segetibacter sp. 3557_3 TaxID=2547429 RepID=UPI001058CD97|nr:DUF4294 domain-containing protein [Segetibacter sp. 3557_3]TDH28934.1 DUF4294 domain-containing protein [Segetibacter sp. 3557_3]